jgi:hypothetical protein
MDKRLYGLIGLNAAEISGILYAYSQGIMEMAANAQAYNPILTNV